MAGSSDDHKKPRIVQPLQQPPKRDSDTLPSTVLKTPNTDHTVPDTTPPLKRGRTINAITIAPVKQVITKRGKTIDITTNEQEDIDWSLLENIMPTPLTTANSHQAS